MTTPAQLPLIAISDSKNYWSELANWLSAFQMTVEQPMTKKLLRPITTRANSATNQSELLAITLYLVLILFLIGWKTGTGRNKSSHLKTALLCLWLGSLKTNLWVASPCRFGNSTTKYLQPWNSSFNCARLVSRFTDSGLSSFLSGRAALGSKLPTICSFSPESFIKCKFSSPLGVASWFPILGSVGLDGLCVTAWPSTYVITWLGFDREYIWPVGLNPHCWLTSLGFLKVLHK